MKLLSGYQVFKNSYLRCSSKKILILTTMFYHRAIRCINYKQLNPIIRQVREESSQTLAAPKEALSTPIFEPPYLEEMRPKVGSYRLLNLQLRGHDFAILEKYQSYLHKTMRKLDFTIVKTWSAPQKEMEIETLVHQSSAIHDNLRLMVYERNIQMKDALVTKIPILIDVINMTLPPGVSFGIHKHSQEEEDRLYYRNSRLEEIKAELEDLKAIPLIGE